MQEQLCKIQLCSLQVVTKNNSQEELQNQSQGDTYQKSQLEQLLQNMDTILMRYNPYLHLKVVIKKINLKEGTNPINVSPYRYPTFQKKHHGGIGN